MRTITVIALSALSLAAASCAPSQTTLDNADYGPQPTDYKATVNAWLDATLVDPDSKKVVFKTQPVKEYTSFSTPSYGWVVGGRVANGGNNLGLFAPATYRNNL